MGIFRQFPYSNFHEMNLDEIIKIMREMQDEWAATKTEWSSYKAFIDNYFNNLDVSEEVLAALRKLAADGTLKTIMDPTIAAETTAWLTQHITPSTPPVDNSLTIQEAAADAYVTGLIRKQIIDNNNYDFLQDRPAINSTTYRGVTYQWNADGTCTLTGTASPQSFNNIVVEQSELSALRQQMVGKSVFCYYTGKKSSLHIIMYDSNAATIKEVYIQNPEVIDIPSNCVGMIIRLYVPNNVSVNETVSFYMTLLSGINIIDTSLKPLKFKYTMPTGMNCNNADLNSIYIVTANTEGAPITTSGFLYTYGMRPNNAGGQRGVNWQIFIVQTTGVQYYRYKVPNSDWSTWRTSAMSYIGGLPAGTDLDTVPPQTVSVAAATEINMPEGVASGLLYHYGSADTGARQQFLVSYLNGVTYYRYKMPNNNWSSWRTSAISYTGGLPAGTDLDTVPPQTVSVATATEINMPEGVASGLLYHYGSADTGARQQFLVSYADGLTYYRHRVGNTDEFTEWMLMSPSSGNGNAKMWSIGNSILTGSVWINGAFNHLVNYNDSPYGNIARAINIPQENVTHTLHSSTGILYDAGEGSFLENILESDLSDEDVVLTHLWIQDMNNYPVGSLSDPAGNNTIVAAIKTIINYLKNQNPNAQFILVSVPPSSTTIKGDNVFTGRYPNGSSISELDTILHQLADALHFTYIDWQDLNLSYYYQDLTDGDNVHLNNDDSYRILGGYLGGRASSKINF